MQGYLADMERVAPPDAAACRALARESLARLDFEIGLAEAGYAGRALQPAAGARAGAQEPPAGGARDHPQVSVRRPLPALAPPAPRRTPDGVAILSIR